MREARGTPVPRLAQRQLGERGAPTVFPILPKLKMCPLISLKPQPPASIWEDSILEAQHEFGNLLDALVMMAHTGARSESILLGVRQASLESRYSQTCFARHAQAKWSALAALSSARYRATSFCWLSCGGASRSPSEHLAPNANSATQNQQALQKGSEEGKGPLPRWVITLLQTTTGLPDIHNMYIYIYICYTHPTCKLIPQVKEDFIRACP